jgi:hypothetical protein
VHAIGGKLLVAVLGIAGHSDRADDLAREHVLGFERAIRAVI